MSEVEGVCVQAQREREPCFCVSVCWSMVDCRWSIVPYTFIIGQPQHQLTEDKKGRALQHTPLKEKKK